MAWKVARMTSNQYLAGCTAMMVAEGYSLICHSVENSRPGKVGVFRAVVECCRVASMHSNPIAGEL